MPRVMTNEIEQRINRVDSILSQWMKENNIPEIDPEGCMDLLVRNDIYNYDNHGKAHYFREDLRTIRDCGMIGILKKIVVTQRCPGARWNISLIK